MRSMTGYGQGRCEVAGRRLVVEIRSVNHRFLELKMRLPWANPLVEQKVGQSVRQRLERGAVSVSVRDEGGAELAPEVTANLALARTYHRALEEIRASCGISAPVDLAVIAAQPGVLTIGEGASDGEAIAAQLAPGVTRALDELIAARKREGEALRADLTLRIANLRQIAADLRQLAAAAPDEARKRLSERLARLTAPADVDPQRLAQEVAILADRADVTEEVTRLGAHLDEVARLVSDEKPAGRRLDFLAQELHREVNTIGAKTQRSEMALRVVDGKSEVERLREQVQNVE